MRTTKSRAVARRRAVVAACGLLAGVALAVAWRRDDVQARAGFVWRRFAGGRTVAERVAQHETAVRRRLQPLLAGAGLASAPREVALLAFKDTRRLALYARDDTTQSWRHVTTYLVQGASGGPGPKLREGDLQVPEGVYRVTLLNPNSRFHLHRQRPRRHLPDRLSRGPRARPDRRHAVGVSALRDAAIRVGELPAPLTLRRQGQVSGCH
jgi:hypothetical protein